MFYSRFPGLAFGASIGYQKANRLWLIEGRWVRTHCCNFDLKVVHEVPYCTISTKQEEIFCRPRRAAANRRVKWNNQTAQTTYCQIYLTSEPKVIKKSHKTTENKATNRRYWMERQRKQVAKVRTNRMHSSAESGLTLVHPSRLRPFACRRPVNIAASLHRWPTSKTEQQRRGQILVSTMKRWSYTLRNCHSWSDPRWQRLLLTTMTRTCLVKLNEPPTPSVS